MPNNFAAGRVLVTVNRSCILPMNADNPMYEGIDVENVEVIFQPHSPPDDCNVGPVLLIHLKSNDEQAIIDAVEKLSVHPCVITTSPDYLMLPHIIPNDPLYRYLWGMEAISAPMAWAVSTGARQVTVGVVDSGVDYNHPDLRDNMRSVPYEQGLYGWNFFNNTYDPMDETGHGTHVAGTIGAVGNNFIGVTGVCWTIGIAALKIGDSIFSSSAAIRAINYANVNRIPILNNSWGTRAYCGSLRVAIDGYDGLFVASAGNDGADNDIFPTYPGSFDCHNLISVAATAPGNALAPFSNYGAICVHIAAPGSDILSTALGGYDTMSGTSMAAPHVAGAAALLKAYRPELSALALKRFIFASVDKQPPLFGRILTGGVLNISRMLQAASTG